MTLDTTWKEINHVSFLAGLLALEGELTPILVQMVKSANTNGLLDNDSDCPVKYQYKAHKAKVPREKLHTCHRKTSKVENFSSQSLPDEIR